MEYIEHKVVFPEIDAPLRTNDSFSDMVDDDHHVGISPLRDLNFDMVTGFPLEYMHLVCLGCTKRLLRLWIKGPLKFRIGPLVKSQISDGLKSLRPFIPNEFARKPRALVELDRWKATEYRLFLLYAGPVVLKGKIPKELYDNFMLLSTGIIILANPTLCQCLNGFAKKLLTLFVQHVANLYGKGQVVYNVHSLLHLADDVLLHGPLDHFSAFAFENFMQELKKLVRKPNLVLEQVVLRMSERSKLSSKLPRCMSRENKMVLKMAHSNGPIPAGNAYSMHAVSKSHTKGLCNQQQTTQ